MSVLLAIDQGTTGTNVLVAKEDLTILATHKVDFRQIFPKPGWVEHNAEDIWRSLQEATEGALAKAGVNASDISAIGITNQRETTCLFDRQGDALHPFIVWQCKRSADICVRMSAQGDTDWIHQKTGLFLDPYFSATKLRWIFEQNPELYRQAVLGHALFGTIDSWLLYRLTNHKNHATDATNASRTLLMDLGTSTWDDSLLAFFDVPKACLPQIMPSAGVFGHTSQCGFLPNGIPITSMIGDQQSALFGQACLKTGDTKITFGTGSFLLLHTGSQPVVAPKGLLTSIALALPNATTYCLEGSAFVAGAAIQWLRDGLQIIKTASEIDSLAAEVPDSGEVVFVPALSGLGAPHWRPEARGLFWGMTRGTTKAHLARAVLEGIAWQNRDILLAMQTGDITVSSIKVDGGAAVSDILMQMQADAIGISCSRPKNLSATAFGTAALAAIGAGVIRDTDFLAKAWQEDRRFAPAISDAIRSDRAKRWDLALAKA